jgi:hypothetical protein
MTRLTAVLEPVIRALSSDDDVLVRRAAANAILIALRPYNVDDAATVAAIAGSNLQFVRPPSCHPVLSFFYSLIRACVRCGSLGTIETLWYISLSASCICSCSSLQICAL